jgi:AraC-like DNA-binding protein
MDSITFNIWSILILLGAVHGIFLGIVLWRKKENHLANRLFAALLFSLSYHLLEYALNISGVILEVPHLLLTSYPLLFLLGPFFYLYVKSLLEYDFRLKRKDLLHFIPALMVLLAFLPFYLQSATEKFAIMQDISDTGFTEIPPEQFVIMFGQILQICIYLFFAYQLIQQKNHAWQDIRSKNLLVRLEWLRKATTVFAVFMLVYAVIVIILVLKESFRVETDYIILLLMSALVFVLGYVAIGQPDIFSQKSLSSPKLLEQTEKANSARAHLLALMESEKPYLLEELKIANLAEMMELPSHQLSEILRTELQVSFPEFIQNYRIAEAKRLLSDPQFNHLKILAVALESGFGNKATFNRVFKEKVGTTPSTFRSQFQK